MDTRGTSLRILTGGAVAVVVVGVATVCLAAEPPPASALPLSETTSLLAAITKVTGSLLVVVGLMLLLLHFIKRTGLGSGGSRSGSAITVLETRMVAPKKYIAIVEIAGHCLALGITDHTISRLADLGPETKDRLSPHPAQARPLSPFAGLLNRSLQAWREPPAPQTEEEPRPNRAHQTEDAP
jgi:flagellar biosynthetic protein FliO